MRIKNWPSFQHFKKRNPPWIKLYRTLLDDPEWHELDAESSKVLVMLWLLASEDKTGNGYLPDIKVISFRLRKKQSDITQHLSKLKHYVIDDDISVISPCHQDDGRETETETETETESLPREESNNGKGVVFKDGGYYDIENGDEVTPFDVGVICSN